MAPHEDDHIFARQDIVADLGGQARAVDRRGKHTLTINRDALAGNGPGDSSLSRMSSRPDPDERPLACRVRRAERARLRAAGQGVRAGACGARRGGTSQRSQPIPRRFGDRRRACRRNCALGGRIVGESDKGAPRLLAAEAQESVRRPNIYRMWAAQWAATVDNAIKNGRQIFRLLLAAVFPESRMYARTSTPSSLALRKREAWLFPSQLHGDGAARGRRLVTSVCCWRWPDAKCRGSPPATCRS